MDKRTGMTIHSALQTAHSHVSQTLRSVYLRATGHVPVKMDGHVVAADKVLTDPATSPEQGREVAALMWNKLQDQIAGWSCFSHQTMHKLFRVAANNIGYQGPIPLAPADKLAPELSSMTGLEISAEKVKETMEGVHRIDMAISSAPRSSMFYGR